MVSWSVLRSASHYQFTFDACCVGGGKNNYYLLTTQGLGCGPLVTSKAGDQKDPQTQGLASYPWSEMRKDIPLRLTLSYYQQSFEKKKKTILLTEKGARDAKPPHSSLPAPGPTFQGRKVITRRVNPVPPTKHFSGHYQSLRSVITTLTGELFWTGDFIFLGEELRFWRGAKAIVVAAQIFAIFPIMRR